MIIFILILATGLRFININQSLWWDEAINVLAVKDYSLWQMISDYPLRDFHPPGYFIILWIWHQLFGSSELVVRLPSVIFGITTVWITYLIGKKTISYSAGLIAALLLALNPLHLFYSQETRMYSFAAFAVTLSFLGLILWIKEKKSPLMYIISTPLILYSDYLAYFSYLAQFFWMVIFFRSKIIKFLLLNVLGAIPFLPWLLVMPEQIKSGIQTSINVPGWAKVVGGSNLKNLGLVVLKSIVGRFSLDNKSQYLLMILPITSIYLAVIYKALFTKNKQYIYLFLFWLVIPVLVSYLVSFFIPVLSYFRVIFILPALFLSLAIGLENFKTKTRQILLLLLVFINLFFSAMYIINPKYQREDWKGMVKTFESFSGDFLVIFENANLPSPFIYYDRRQFAAIGGLKNFPADTDEDIMDLSQIKQTDKIYLVEYLVEISDPNRLIEKQLTGLGYTRKNVFNFNGVGFVYEFVRNN